jgi:hypothetical protein
MTGMKSKQNPLAGSYTQMKTIYPKVCGMILLVGLLFAVSGCRAIEGWIMSGH